MHKENDMGMTKETLDRFVKAARTLCELRCVDPDARVYSRDGMQLPDGPTNERLAAGDMYRFTQINCALQKHGLDRFEFDRGTEA
jgi:hypothetical protein